MFSTCDTRQALVLDEADRMFDLGFIADIRLPHAAPAATGKNGNRCCSPPPFPTGCWSSPTEHMNNPELVRIEPDKMTVDRVRQIMYYPSMEEKVPLLVGLLRQAEARRTMIFVNTKAGGGPSGSKAR